MPRPTPSPKQRPLKPLTPERLKNGALFYLERYDSSAANLKRVLRQRVERGLLQGRLSEEQKHPLLDHIDSIVQMCIDRGLINDQRTAESLIRRLLRQGKGLSQINQTLRQKGITPETAEHAFSAVQTEAGSLDAPASLHNLTLEAAWTYARKRRLGPYRPDQSTRPDNRQRDLAALARRGFDYATATAIIDADPLDAPG